jgi:hypothetical protein
MSTLYPEDRISPLPYSPFGPFSPMGQGFRFVSSRARDLFLIGLLPIVLKIACTYASFSFPLRRAESFLVLAVSAFSDAWLIYAIVGYILVRNKIKIVSSFFQSPKTLLSYGGVMFAVVLAFKLPFMLFFALFLLWAPYFVSAENHSAAKPKTRKVEQDEDFFEEQAPSSSFSEMGLLDLGYIRSLKFTGDNLLLTFQLFVLLWCAEAVPFALIRSFYSERMGFWGYAVDTFFSSYFVLVIFAAGAVAFLLSLPREAQAELKHWKDTESELKAKKSEQVVVAASPQGLRSVEVPLSTLIVIALMSTIFLQRYSEEELDMPQTVQIQELETKKSADGEFSVSYKLKDDAWHFRWLDEDRLEAIYSDSTDKISLDPSRVILYDQNKKPIEEMVRPYFGELIVETRFKLLPKYPEPKSIDIVYRGFNKDRKRILSKVEIAK